MKRLPATLITATYPMKQTNCINLQTIMSSPKTINTIYTPLDQRASREIAPRPYQYKFRFPLLRTCVQ
ncbi:hypothetical protein Hanom_Chr03g00191321 [Helianthus anomalus]